ncbi:MAG TPA: CHAP domain-containing protein [Stellaceae bacterium]|nr:CHAP domain-containing protein [Stellaceae bacterium]
MRAKLAWGLVWGALPMVLLALYPRHAVAGNCVLYARAQTGVALYGDAGDWWGEAAGRYQRGHVPEVGSILVFRRSDVIPSGHVAIVAGVIGPREIVVNQANWYHGEVTPGVPVVDESPRNDWTTVAVMDIGSGHYGQDYPSYGFVYPQTGPSTIVADASSSGGVIRGLEAIPTAYDPDADLSILHTATTTDDDLRRRYARHRGRGSHRRRWSTQLHHPAPAARDTGRTGRTHILARNLAHALHHAPAPHHAPALPATRRAESRTRHRA